MHIVSEGLNTTISLSCSRGQIVIFSIFTLKICFFYAIQYDYDLCSFFLFLFPSPLIFGYITYVNPFFDLIMHLPFDSLNFWVGTTISLSFFLAVKNFSKCSPF
jgi:hypothetical protein